MKCQFLDCGYIHICQAYDGSQGYHFIVKPELLEQVCTSPDHQNCDLYKMRMQESQQATAEKVLSVGR